MELPNIDALKRQNLRDWSEEARGRGGEGTVHLFGKRQNPPLLLLHGIGTGHRLWLRQIERFEPSHFVLAPDLPGLTGAGAGGEVSILAIAKCLADELAAEAIDDITVCGISAGASVALALAGRADARISRLVLSAPQARHFSASSMTPQVAIWLRLSPSFWRLGFRQC